MERVLEECRPVEFTSRKSAIYCFDKLAHCKRFGDAQHLPAAYLIYQVVSDQEVGHPIEIVDHIYRLVKSGACQATIYKAAKEYWDPDSDWKYLEYLCSICQVATIIEPSQYEMSMPD